MVCWLLAPVMVMETQARLSLPQLGPLHAAYLGFCWICVCWTIAAQELDARNLGPPNSSVCLAEMDTTVHTAVCVLHCVSYKIPSALTQRTHRC